MPHLPGTAERGEEGERRGFLAGNAIIAGVYRRVWLDAQRKKREDDEGFQPPCITRPRVCISTSRALEIQR
ncbi:unnamed protein product [Cuscuta campestris]|uniref:Uncharacterized protein n=1 Tax=Cuscuta campestris TaxID=132261 RepID=A0A484LJ16_9ASTE|nr:unnamed protein product [Cuscuta campestris]